MEFIDVFATKVRREPAMVEPMEIKVDQSKWQLPCNLWELFRSLRLQNGVKFTLFLNLMAPGDSP